MKSPSMFPSGPLREKRDGSIPALTSRATRRNLASLLALWSLTSLWSLHAAQTIARPPLLFREDWKEIPAVTGVTQEHVANPDLIMTRLGPGEEKIRKSHHDTPADDPFYIWSGECERPWALSLKHRSALIDLSGPAKIRWRAKQTGFRQLRIILKLADGKWIIGDQFDDESTDWRVREFFLPDMRWRTFDVTKIAEGKWVAAPDLSKVDEIGFTDLMAGGGTPASSRLDWIEVYGKAVPRK